LLDAEELAGDGSDKAFSEMLQDAFDGDVARLRSQGQWLESMKRLVLRDVVQAALFLDLCEARLAEQKERWPLRDEALQVFSMADRNGDRQLDMTELTEARQSDEFARAMLDAADVDKNGTLSRGEWLEYVKRLADNDQESTAALLALCRKRLSNSSNTVDVDAYRAAENTMDVLAVEDSTVRINVVWKRWPLRDEALQVFSMADRNGDRQLDMSELTNVRQSDEFARAMLDAADVDKNGTLNRGEWLAYVKRLADHDQESAAAVLALYRKHLSNSSNTADVDAYLPAKNTMDVLVVDDSTVRTSQHWWACY